MKSPIGASKVLLKVWAVFLVSGPHLMQKRTNLNVLQVAQVAEVKIQTSITNKSNLIYEE